jgi:CBS domain-containing protein
MEGADACANCGAPLIRVELHKTQFESEGGFMRQPLTALGLTKPHTIGPEQPLEEAVRVLKEEHLDLLNVVEEGKLIGVLSVRDVMTRAGPHYQDKLAQPVRVFMTRSPVTLPPDAAIPFALNQMDVGGYRHVPVVEGERLLGLVTARDCLRYFFKNRKN